MSDIVKRLRVRRNPMLDGEREEAAAEVERLRGLLGDVQIILDSHNNIVGNLNGEIEWLRGLLRDTLDMYKDGPWADAYWIKRVREALGDE